MNPPDTQPSRGLHFRLTDLVSSDQLHQQGFDRPQDMRLVAVIPLGNQQRELWFRGPRYGQAYVVTVDLAALASTQLQTLRPAPPDHRGGDRPMAVDPSRPRCEVPTGS